MPLLGNPVDENTAKQLAQNFWKENNIMGVKGDKVFKKKMDDARFVNVAPQCGYSEFYIFNNEDGKGFVIIAADDCVTPILAYSYDNNFAAENLPPNLKEWLDGYAEQIQIAVEMRVTATGEIRTDWESLRRGKNLPIRTDRRVYPLITTTWDQHPLYNESCPYSNYYSQLTLTGCVATAMAQIMKYWEYPLQGTGEHTYTHTAYIDNLGRYHDAMGELSANFGNTIYDWENMPVALSSSSTSIQINAIAELMYHCGVSVEMDYGVSGVGGSGAQILSYNGYQYFEYCSENAFKTFFDYKSTLHGELKNNYNDSQWISILKNDLDNARPILYAGYGTNGGHAFVCDGYDNNNRFHFNWGWSGNGQGVNNDAYCYINSLIPEGSSYNFSSGQQAVVGIEPNNPTYNFNLVYYSTPIMSNNEYDFFDNMSVYAEVWNVGSGAFNGYIGAGVYYEEVPGSNQYYYLDIMDYWDRTSTPLPGTYYVYGDLDCAGGPPYIPGSYAIAMLYSIDGSLWNFIDLGNYDYAYFDITSSHRINVRSEFTILTGDGTCLYQNSDATVNVDIKNAGSETFYGQFRISLLNSTGNWMQTIDIFDCTNGLQPNYHYTNGLDFTGLITVEPGTYLMSVDYKESGSSNWYYAGASDYQNPVWVYVAPEPIYADPYEPNNSQNLAYSFTPSFSGNTATINTTGSNLHNSSDVDYYKINLNAGYDYTITPRLHDAFNSGNGNTYSVDGMFAYSTDGVNWSQFYDDVMTGNFSIIDGGMVYFDVISYFEGDIGTYLLSVGITRTQHANDYIISVSANPSNGGSVSGGGTFTQGQSCTVHATANSGYTFVNWTENGTQVSTNANYTFTVTGNRNLVANFLTQQQQYTINVSANPSNGGSVSTTGDLSYNFDNGFDGWTTIDADGDGYNWRTGDEVMGTGYGHNGSGDLLLSQSYENDYGALYPDNYLVSPQVALCGSISFWACAQDNNYPSEHFGVAVSTTSNTNANSFTTIQEWTMTAKGDGKYSNHSRVRNSRSQGNWYLYTVDLSAYSGQSGYIAIRHFNCSDMFFLDIDDVSITSNGGNTYYPGQTCTVNATANSGYTFVNWTEDGTQVSTNPSYSFTVNGNRNLVANFQAQAQQYTISVSANPSNGGSVSGGGTFNQGASCTVHATANSGYTFVNWTENGTQVSTNANYTFMVTGNRNLVANFSQSTYTITATAGANGFITPSGTVVVAGGSNQTFTIIPDYGYEVNEVYVDGGLIGAPSSYTFQNVTSNHTIFATFIRIDGIDDNDGMAFVIYPNPTSGIVNILCQDAELFNIYSTYGQLLISQTTNGNDQVTIDISNLPSGIYLIQLVSKEGLATKQIIKIP